jgi:hypothetical protein
MAHACSSPARSAASRAPRVAAASRAPRVAAARARGAGARGVFVGLVGLVAFLGLGLSACSTKPGAAPPAREAGASQEAAPSSSAAPGAPYDAQGLGGMQGPAQQQSPRPYPPPPPKPGDDDEAPAASATEAEERLARAQRRLDEALALEARHAAAPTTPQKTPMPSPAGASACFEACRALASMRRSATQLCALAGGQDARCVAAKKRTDDASTRVRAACPSCTS